MAELDTSPGISCTDILMFDSSVLLVHSPRPQGTDNPTQSYSTPDEGSVDFDVDLQSHVEHHRRDEVDVREPDSQAPCEIKKYQQSPRQPFGKHSIGPTGGSRKP